tara:strand:+ start:414 stop:737 length:324 start_codon:yes stop_codon:yes gene_type:complete
MKTYYFSETSPADAAGDAILLPQSSFLSMDVASDTEIVLNFKKTNGTHDKTSIKIGKTNAGEAVDTMAEIAEVMAGNTTANVIDIVERANSHPVSSVHGIKAITISE